MQAYQMRGTPTTLLIDRQGHLRLHEFGRPDDMRLGAAIATLIGEAARQLKPAEAAAPSDGCEIGACVADPEQAAR